MPRKAPRKPPYGNDLLPQPMYRQAPRPTGKLPKPQPTMKPGTKKKGAGTGTARRTAPRPTKGYR